jgi:hypothetical protein
VPEMRSATRKPKPQATPRKTVESLRDIWALSTAAAGTSKHSSGGAAARACGQRGRLSHLRPCKAIARRIRHAPPARHHPSCHLQPLAHISPTLLLLPARTHQAETRRAARSTPPSPSTPPRCSGPMTRSCPRMRNCSRVMVKYLPHAHDANVIPSRTSGAGGEASGGQGSAWMERNTAGASTTEVDCML